MINACVIGNGPSRKYLDLKKIDESMITYGCNAIYRDFLPNYLVSMDNYMVNEILQNNIHHVVKLYTQHSNKIDELAEYEPIYFVKNHTSTIDSGNAAIELAANKHSVVYIIGFDYNIDDSSMPNVYQHTKHYHNDVYFNSEKTKNKWRSTLQKIIRSNVDTQFIRVSNIKLTDIDEKNYSEITIEQFKEIYE